ncbi:MAG: lytic transglycosylase domain-containing protein [Pseudonocardiaceae bacterium]
MPRSGSGRGPAAYAVLVAVAVGGALLPIAKLSNAAAPPSPLTVAASPVPASPIATSQGEVSPQATSRAQQSGQSLDEPAPQRLPYGPLGIPGVMLDAYQRAAREMAEIQPGCHLSWSTLAGIGRVESGHASGGRVDTAGNTLEPILGPRLDGSMNTVAIADTDHGTLDVDPVWVRAVGPMQFIPTSWRIFGVGNPNNIYDSTLAAGRYLCAGGGDLSDQAQEAIAVYRYNHSATYASTVLLWAHAYLTGVVPTPSEQELVPQTTEDNQGSQVRTVARSTQQVVAQLDSPPVARLDPSPPARLDTPPPAATAPSPQSLDSPTAATTH